MIKRSYILLLVCLLVLTGCAEKVGKARVNDIEMAYREFGRGYPLILIMGYSGTMDFWSPAVLRELARHYRVIVFDNRGMGSSTAGVKKFTIPQFTDDAAGLLTALKIRQAHVLGWSMGTNIALDLAIRYPDKVNKLIIYAGDPGGKAAILPAPAAMRMMTDTSGTPQERGMRLLKLMFPADWLKKNPDPRRYLPAQTETSSAQNIDRQTEAMASWAGCYSKLSSIKSPTLLLTGTDDILTPPENTSLLAKKIAGAKVAKIKGGGHGMMFQYPEKFTRIILDFLEK